MAVLDDVTTPSAPAGRALRQRLQQSIFAWGQLDLPPAAPYLMQRGINFEVGNMDMSSAVARGNAVLFAWAADYTPIKPLYHITPKRAHQNTLWRVTVPLQ